MITFIALLRGINVSGSNLIRMEALKTSMENIGLTSVKTYIQSGNLVFNYAEMANPELEILIKWAIERDFGFQIPVIVKTALELNNAIHNNPFINKSQIAIESLHITFLSDTPEEHLIDNLMPLKDGMDEGQIIKNNIYLFCPDGYGRTKFTNTYFEKKLKVQATTRNWKTLLKLKEIVEE
jgi:uncharacterized protein (DUF1697 family)